MPGSCFPTIPWPLSSCFLDRKGREGERYVYVHTHTQVYAHRCAHTGPHTDVLTHAHTHTRTLSEHLQQLPWMVSTQCPGQGGVGCPPNEPRAPSAHRFSAAPIGPDDGELQVPMCRRMCRPQTPEGQQLLAHGTLTIIDGMVAPSPHPPLLQVTALGLRHEPGVPCLP